MNSSSYCCCLINRHCETDFIYLFPNINYRGKLREAWENTVSIEQAELATLKLAPALDALLPKQQPVRIKNDDGSVTVVPGNEVAPDLVLMKVRHFLVFALIKPRALSSFILASIVFKNLQYINCFTE